MKKTLTILLFFSFTITVNAQYESIFGEEKTVWTMTRTYSLGIAFDSCLIQGDTLINDLIYKKGKWLINEPLPLQEPDFYIREDTIEGKAWAMILDIEYLFMDLSLTLGDSIYMAGLDWLPNHPNPKVDSIYYFDNKKHIRLNCPFFWEENEKITFIEGVGSNIGYVPGAFFLLCAKKDNADIYETQNTSYNNVCDIPTTTTFFNSDVVFLKVYPNPATNYFELALNSKLIAARKKITLTIFDVMGRILHSEQFTSAAFPKKISTTFWNKSLYYIRLQSDHFNYMQSIIIH